MILPFTQSELIKKDGVLNCRDLSNNHKVCDHIHHIFLYISEFRHIKNSFLFNCHFK